MAEDLPTRLQFELVTPDRPVVSESVLAVSLPGKSGYLGILPGHAPLLTELKPGELSYTSPTAAHHVAVSTGVAEVLGDRVTVLAQTSEKADQIDVARAERAKQRAEERLRDI